MNGAGHCGIGDSCRAPRAGCRGREDRSRYRHWVLLLRLRMVQNRTRREDDVRRSMRRFFERKKKWVIDSDPTAFPSRKHIYIVRVVDEGRLLSLLLIQPFPVLRDYQCCECAETACCAGAVGLCSDWKGLSDSSDR